MHKLDYAICSIRTIDVRDVERRSFHACDLGYFLCDWFFDIETLYVIVIRSQTSE